MALLRLRRRGEDRLGQLLGLLQARGQPSFDKQYVRDWAAGSGWDKAPPAPAIPDDVVARTRELYVEAYERITGESFSGWLDRTAA